MNQRIGNMPKACPYVMMRPPIVADKNHRACEGKRDSGIFLFALSDNLISKDWFFAEGERFLSTEPRVGRGINLFFTIITDPLRGSPHTISLSPSYAQSLCNFRLHGVSHNAASPMPVASNFIFGGILHIFCTNWCFFTKNHYICKSKIINFIKILKP